MKDITYDPLSEQFYFYTHSEKEVYQYQVNSGSISKIAENLKGYSNNRSTGRIISVDSDNYIFIKASPNKFLIVDGETKRIFDVSISVDYKSRGAIFYFYPIGDYKLLLITTKGFI